MKKILIVGPKFYGYSQSVAKAFRNAGYQVELFDEWTEGSVDNFKEKVIYNLSKDKAAFFKKKYEQFNVQIRKAYTGFSPDIVFIIRGEIVTEATLKFMKGSKLVLWMMDSIFTVPNTLLNIALYDHVFLFEKEDIPVLGEKHNITGHFLPLALDQDVYFPIPSADKPIDILFVGNLYEKRVALFNKIIEKYPDINFKIYGIYFSKLRNLKRYFFRRDKQFYMNRVITPAELNKLYSKTKICLNIHHNQSVYGVNQRFFEVCGAGTLQVCDRHGFITDNFINDEIVIYDSDEQLFEQIKLILADYESFRNKIDIAFREVTTKHTFDKRIQYILQTINTTS